MAGEEKDTMARHDRPPGNTGEESADGTFDAEQECSHCGGADTDFVCDACADVLADEQTRHQEWF